MILSGQWNPSRAEGRDVELCAWISKQISYIYDCLFSCSYSIDIACTFIFSSLAFVIHCLYHIHHSYLSVSLISSRGQLSTVDYLKITKEMSLDENFSSTQWSHFNTNADLAPNYKRGPQPVQCLNSSTEVNQIHVPTQMQSSTNPHFSSIAELNQARIPVQTQSSAKLAF